MNLANNKLDTFKKCTEVTPATNPKTYMMIFSADTDNKVSWTKYSDDLCTTKLIPEGDDTNEVDIVYDGTTCNNVLD